MNPGDDSPPPGEAPGAPGRGSSRGALVKLLVLLALLAGTACWVVLGGAELLDDVRRWVDGLGVWGPVVFVLCYALAVTVLLPGSVLTASAGALFGMAVGVVVVLAGATASAVVSFGLARWLGRPAVARWTGSGRLARLDVYLARRGFVAILLLRMVALFPFAAVNYGAGVAGVRFAPYVAATALGIVPATVVYTGLGGALGDPGSPLLWLAPAGLLVLSAAGWWATKLLRARTADVSEAAGNR
ncbi:TVP38/TMEM64 family protein [Streptomyces sp. WMMC500]|uniref:TVP38/TMEM64 family protein n=1 Tax=Streptomyces sp. WMMC500 TaxID=3015154 RepID=UPI00248AA88F|nr:TVP38/TMEM64 family protein [Streptomyces sp. WMMC500]WBB61807.1 TVP38/TMEM64 family protein [Streptomyces sp. WMMC500]